MNTHLSLCCGENQKSHQTTAKRQPKAHTKKKKKVQHSLKIRDGTQPSQTSHIHTAFTNSYQTIS